MHPSVVAGAAGLAAHLVFNRREPTTAEGHITLVLGVPTIIGVYLFKQGAYTSLLWSILSTSFVYLATLTTSIVAYRLSPFHPLAKYPGPLIARVTRFWAFYKVYGRRQHFYYHDLHKKYGEVVRTGPNHLFIRDVNAIPTILGGGLNGWHRGGRHYATKPKDTLGNMIDIERPIDHAPRRRIWDRAFTTASIKDYEPMIEKRAAQLVHALDERKGQNVDIASWLSFFALDFMGDLAFDGTFNFIEKGRDDEHFQRDLELGDLDLEWFGTIPWVRPFINLLPDPPSLRKACKIAEDHIVQRKKKGTMRKDVFFYLLDEDGSSGHEELSVDTLIWESLLVLVAGHDTTAVTLSNLFFYLLNDRDVFLRLRKEIDDNIPGNVEMPDSSSLAKLPLLNAVLNETMRLQPAVPNGVQRKPPPGTPPTMVANVLVPPGTTVQVPTYSIQRDPRYFWPHPESFWPDRWLRNEKTSSDPEFRHNANAWIPFSHGPTVCIGKQLAMIEMRLVVALLVRRFDYRFKPGWDTSLWEKSLREGFVMSKGNLPVVVTARTDVPPAA